MNLKSFTYKLKRNMVDKGYSMPIAKAISDNFSNTISPLISPLEEDYNLLLKEYELRPFLGNDTATSYEQYQRVLKMETHILLLDYSKINCEVTLNMLKNIIMDHLTENLENILTREYNSYTVNVDYNDKFTDNETLEASLYIIYSETE